MTDAWPNKSLRPDRSKGTPTRMSSLREVRRFYPKAEKRPNQKLIVTTQRWTNSLCA